MKVPTFNHVEELKDKFHVITMISNPMRFDSRYVLYQQFKDHMEQTGVVHFHTIEIQQGDREFQVTSATNPYDIQLRTKDAMWIKENAINIAIQRLTPEWKDWKYVAWIDADIHFVNPNWVQECIEELQVNHFLQLFQSAIDLGPNGESLKMHNSFMYCYWNNLPASKKYQDWHPGFAWAATREALNSVGNLIEGAIVGSADRHMAAALIGKGLETVPATMTDDYKDMVASWEKRAVEDIRFRVGYMKGTILHDWHGKKKDRGYADRWQILVKHNYSPYKHVFKDTQGLLQFDKDALFLAKDIKKYFMSRNEDSIDLV
jgi:hypothetical protein